MRLKVLAALVAIVNMENIMQEALEIHNLFKKSDKIYQFTNAEQIKQKFKKQGKQPVLDEDLLPSDHKPVEIFLPKDIANSGAKAEMTKPNTLNIPHWSQDKGL